MEFTRSVAVIAAGIGLKIVGESWPISQKKTLSAMALLVIFLKPLPGNLQLSFEIDPSMQLRASLSDFEDP